MSEIHVAAPGDLQAQKADLRRSVRLKKADRAAAWFEDRSVEIQLRVLSMDGFREAGTVCSYVATKREARTDRIAALVHGEERTLCVPAYRSGEDVYAPARLDRNADMVAGPHGALEPRVKLWVAPGTVEVILVPGVAFDACGGRLGHGGGYYDRLIGQCRAARHGRLTAIGLAFSFQVVEQVPCGGRDEALDYVVTEERIIRCVGCTV